MRTWVVTSLLYIFENIGYHWIFFYINTVPKTFLKCFCLYFPTHCYCFKWCVAQLCLWVWFYCETDAWQGYNGKCQKRNCTKENYLESFRIFQTAQPFHSHKIGCWLSLGVETLQNPVLKPLIFAIIRWPRNQIVRSVIIFFTFLHLRSLWYWIKMFG